jgi:hypothetical protein
MSGYGTLAITADAWTNERAQAILTAGLPPLPGAELRSFDPTEQRDDHGRWSLGGGIVRALLKIGDGSLRLEHHGDGKISIHDEHGGSLHLSSKDLESRGGFRRFAFHGPEGLDKVGQRDWMTKAETHDGRPFSTAHAGIHKTHIGTSAEAGTEHDPYQFDRQTLHLAPGGKGVDDPAKLFAHPGVEMTTDQLGNLADTLQSFAHAQQRIDTGHGSVAMHVVGKDFTLDIGKSGELPVVLNRGEARNVEKAIDDAFELQAGQQFRRVIPIKGSGGDVVVTRNGPDDDFHVENDTTSIRITPDAIHDFAGQLDTMLNFGPDLKPLKPIPQGS